MLGQATMTSADSHYDRAHNRPGGDARPGMTIGMTRAVIALTVLIAACFCLAPPSSAQVALIGAATTMRAFPCAPAIPPSAPRVATARPAAAPGASTIPLRNVRRCAGSRTRCRPASRPAINASGVRGSGVIEPRNQTREFSIDRPGGDYRTLEVPAESNGEACRLACEADSQCRAWTYLRPGYVDAGARCYLKNRLTPPRHRPCCISGVER